MGTRFPSGSILACGLALAFPSAAVAAGSISIPVPASAVAVAAPDAVKPRVEVRLLIDPTPAPGRVARVGALFTLDPGWHLYWRNPGDAGLPTRVRWHADGAELGPLAWPAPEVFRDAEAGLTSYGYSGAVLLASDLGKLGPRQGPRELRADAEFLICKDQCIPGKVSLARDLDGALAGGAGAERTHALFEQFAARVPLPAEKLGVGVGVRGLEGAERAGAPVRALLRVDPCARPSDSADSECSVESADFVPDASPSVSLSDASSGASAGAFELALEGRATRDGARRDARLAGVLELRARDGRVRAVALDLSLAAGTPAKSGGGTGASFAGAFLLAALGGAILNLMPCVLPVLALKLFALAELGRQSRRQTLAHALGYFAGVEVTMLALAALVIALRAAGSYVGWGFQFQEPRFALAITLLLVGFALNLFGVFEIGAPTALGNVGADASGVARSFFDGLLAVVLATPCSAPFLGTAVGFAFAGSALDVAVIFAAIGFGLAAPLSLVAVAPGVAARMPRSGPWMGQLRTALGFALLASAIWTLWIFGRTAGIDALGAALGLALALALAAWVFGSFQASERVGRGLAVAGAIALVAGFALRAAWHAAPPAPSAEQASASSSAWRRFDPDAIAGELRAGRPVFVDFTAAWCLTCAVNERAVIASARVQDVLARRDFALFRADWTLRDESIRRELARFGRAGVPLYVVYDPAAPGEPRVLSELLTVDALVDALHERGARGA